MEMPRTKAWVEILAVFLLLSASLKWILALDSNSHESCVTLRAEDLDMQVFPDPNSPNYVKLYYRFLMVDEESKSLFVGAMNHIFKLNLTDITDKQKEITLDPDSQQKVRCMVQGKNKNFECQNHIRFIARNKTASSNTIDGSSPLYVCSTGAYRPQRYHLSIELGLISDSSKAGVAHCPFDPFDNATAVLAETGNPGGGSAVYTGTVADFNKADPIIYRPSLYNSDGSLASQYLRNLAQDTSWLNSPQFVGSFDVGDQVLFFFREIASECTDPGKKFYSRVAKVCKSDRGAYDILKNEWTSFQKARLNCSIPAEYPYYFDEIQDVYTEDNKVFYGLFTRNINGLTASAICAFTATEIERAFSGLFKYQDEHNNWQVEDQMPIIRPGNCSIDDTTTLPTESLSFIRARPLMDTVVSHMYGRPIFHKTNCLMQKLAVVSNISGHNNIVFFTASNRGEVFKIVSQPSSDINTPPSSGIVTTYIPFEEPSPIWSMKLWQNRLYLGTDTMVSQIGVITCSSYVKVDACVNDPYCAWAINRQTEECMADTRQKNALRYNDIDWSHPLEPQFSQKLGENLLATRNNTAFIGLTLTLKMEYKLCIDGPVLWKKDNKSISQCSDYIQALDHSLIISKITTEHTGIYEAFDDNNRKIAVHSVEVTEDVDAERKWKKEFQDWCNAFSNYKVQMNKWESTCLSQNSVNVPPN